jgi:parvulin-like peptidyl-prolyl isomerase
MMKKLLLGGVVSAAMLGAVSGAEAKPVQLTPEQMMQMMQQAPAITIADALKGVPEKLAVFNGVDFTKKDLEEALKQQFKDGKLPPGVTAQMVKQALPQMVTQMVQQQLMLDAMKKAGIVPSAKMVRESMEKQLKEASKEELDFLAQMLAQQNKTMENLINEQSQNPAVQQQVALDTFLKTHVVKDVKVTEADALAYYNANPQQFTEPADPADSVRASHILIMVDDKASDKDKQEALAKINKIHAELKQNPKNFEALAKANSQCPSAAQGGSLGAFQKGRMVPEFEKAAFALKENEISGVVKTPYGYHIIRRDPAAKAQKLPFAQVKAQLINFLTGMKRQQAVQAYLNELLKKSDFKLLAK